MQAPWVGTLEEAGGESVRGRVSLERNVRAGPAPPGCPWPCYVSLRSAASGSRGYFDGSGGRTGKLEEQGVHST